MLESGKGRFEDKAGNSLDGEPIGPGIDGAPTGDGQPGGEYFIDFVVDIDVEDAVFVNAGPLGSLISTSYDNDGFVNEATDEDSFRFFAQAGDTLSAFLELDSEVTAKLELIGPVTVTPPITSSEPGAPIVMPTVPLPLDGFYEFRVTADGVTHYELDITRNAVYERILGDSEDGNELPMDESFVDLGSGRYGVVGHSETKLEFDFFNEPAKFVDISESGTALNLADDAEFSTKIDVENEIFPGGILTISNNGGIVAGFGRGSNIFFQNLPLPAPDIGRALFPYWDDLDDTTGNVYYEELMVDGVETLVVQWERPHIDLSGSEIVFQVQVPEDEIHLARFAYEDVEFGEPKIDFGNSATIGYQESEEVAFQFSFGALDRVPDGDMYPPEVNVADGDVVDLFKIPDVDEYTLDLSTARWSAD